MPPVPPWHRVHSTFKFWIADSIRFFSSVASRLSLSPLRFHLLVSERLLAAEPLLSREFVPLFSVSFGEPSLCLRDLARRGRIGQSAECVVQADAFAIEFLPPRLDCLPRQNLILRNLGSGSFLFRIGSGKLGAELLAYFSPPLLEAVGEVRPALANTREQLLFSLILVGKLRGERGVFAFSQPSLFLTLQQRIHFPSLPIDLPLYVFGPDLCRFFDIRIDHGDHFALLSDRFVQLPARAVKLSLLVRFLASQNLPLFVEAALLIRQEFRRPNQALDGALPFCPHRVE